jgi:hypothetical protein
MCEHVCGNDSTELLKGWLPYDAPRGAGVLMTVIPKATCAKHRGRTAEKGHVSR